MAQTIKKAVIPAAGLGTRFLPLSKVLAKEMLPLVDKPMISYMVKEAAMSGISEQIIVIAQRKKNILECFRCNEQLEEVLQARKKDDLLKNLHDFDSIFKEVKFSTAIQPKPRGDGDAVLKAKKQIGKDPFAVLFADDIFVSKVPALQQLINVFETSGKTVIGLKKVGKDKVSQYGCAKVEKIANRLYKIKDFVEKPKKEEAPSDLVSCGRYVFSNDILKYLSKTKPNQKGEIILASAIKDMINDGIMVYGYEIDADWLECGTMGDWIKSNFVLIKQHPVYGKLVK